MEKKNGNKSEFQDIYKVEELLTKLGNDKRRNNN